MKFPRRRFLRLAVGAATLPVVPSAPALGQGTTIPTNVTLIVEPHNTSPSLVWPPRSSMYNARLPPCASRSGFQPVKYSLNILAVTAASRMSLGNAPSPT